MQIVNDRLIIGENIFFDEKRENFVCEVLRKIVQNKLDELGHPNVIANVEFNFDCTNNDLTYFWNELNIDLMTSDGFLSTIQYSTNSTEPTLVYVNGNFVFYHVFELSSHGCTSLKHMKNTGFCEFDKTNDTLLENILIEELTTKLEKRMR